MFYKPVKFKTQELVSKVTYEEIGELALEEMDGRILYDLDLIRISINKPIIVNNWIFGGSLNDRGFRENTDTGSKRSQHKYGRAIDFTINGMDAEEIRQYIIKRRDQFKNITVMEAGVPWVHMDCRNIYSPTGKIILINP